MTSLRQRMIQDMQVRNLAIGTQDSYVRHVLLFARHFNKSPELLGPEQIRSYQIYLTNERSWRQLRSPSPSRRFASSIGLPSRKTGHLKTSSRLRKSPRDCPLSSAQRKSSGFSATSRAGNIARS